MIVKSNSIREIIQLKNRKGDLLIYGHNPVKGYGPGLNVSYDFQKLEAPIVTSVNMVKGFALLVSNMPSTANSIRFYIVGSVKTDILNSTGNTITYTGDADIYRVKAAFIDAIGEGVESNELLVTVSATIDPALLDKESLGLKEFDKRVNELSEEFNKISNEYSTKVQNLAEDVESRFTQLDEGIELKVTKGLKALDGKAILSRINLYEGGVKIDGKLIHITGDTLIDGNIITNKMLQANSITADKLQVNSLSTISAYIGDTLRGGKLIGTEIQNGSGTFKVDPNGNIVGANITGSRIDASSIFQSGYKIKNIDVQIYKVRHGDWCPLPEGFNENQCTFVPVGYIQTESYFLINSRYRKNNPRTGPTIEESEYKQQKSRYIGSCDLYMLQENERGAHVGIAGKRRAVVEAKSSSVWSGGGDNGNTYSSTSYSYGELYVLVIARQ